MKFGKEAPELNEEDTTSAILEKIDSDPAFKAEYPPIVEDSDTVASEEEVVEKPEETEETVEKPEDEVDPDAIKAPEPSDEKDTEAEPEKTEVQKETGEKKPSDEFGDLPEDTHVKTKERFHKMKESFDTQAKELDTVKQQNEEWFGTLERIGTNPDQIGLTFEYLALVNEGTPESLEKAYAFMEREMGVLAQAIGKTAPGYDPLDAHPDLKQEYENGEISEERAREIANIRAARSLQTRKEETNNARTQEETLKAEATQGLTDLGVKLRSKDPYFASKIPALHGIVKAVCRPDTDPRTWISTIEEAYLEIPNPSPPPPRPSAPNPIRPGHVSPGQSGLTKEPGNIYDAVDQALERM